jgi:hypothetical protein
MKRSSFIYFSLSVILFFLSYFIVGFYYETNDDFAMDYSLRGLIGPSISNFYICLNGISEVFERLYRFFPGFQFYSSVLYLFLLISVVNVFSLLDKVLAGLTLWEKICLLVLFYYLILLENVMYFNFTRVAILLCASSLLQIYFVILEKKGFIQIFFYSMLLFIGALIRGEAFYLSCFLVLPGILLMEYYRSGKQGKVFFQVLITGFMVCFASQALIYFLNGPSVAAYINLTSYVTDYNVIDKSKILTDKEQLYYEGIYKWFFADGNIFSFKNLKTFIDQKSHDLFYFNFNKIIFSLRLFIDTLIHNYFSILIINACIIFYFMRTHAVSKYFFVFFNIYVWSLLILVAVLFKVEDRVLGPALAIYTLLNFLIAFKNASQISYKRIAVVLAGALVILYSVKVVHRAQSGSERRMQNTAALEQIRKVSFKSPYVVATIVGRYFTFLDPFKRYDCGLDNKLIRLSGWLAVFPQNHEMIRKIAGKDSLVDLFQYCLDKKIPFIAEEDELDFLRRYFKAFYGKDLRFEQAENTNGIPRIYYLKKI